MNKAGSSCSQYLVADALKTSEERYRRLFETAQDGILLVDFDTGKITDVNPFLIDILSYSKADFLEKYLWDIGVFKDVVASKDNFQELQDKEYIRYENLPLETNNGKEIKVEFVSNVYMAGGKRVIQCNIRDITERKKAEEELKASEESYRAIFESANDAIIVRDINTYEIIDANEKACKMFCYSKEAIRGLLLGSLSANSEQYPIEKFKSFYEKASKGEPQLFEWPARDKFGREFWIEISVKRAIIGGQYRLLYIARDITERKQLLEQKDSFLNMVSHELRTPLSAIKESVSLISEGKVGSINEKEKEMIGVAKRNVDRLARLINDVLDIQKIDAGMMKLSASENDINEAIEEIHRAMISLATKKGLNFILKLDDKLPGVKFDKDKILQVLINLVNNAIKFTEKGDITIISTQENNSIRVSVKDTGPGIKTEDLYKLFQRFSQLKRIPGGTGLGLAICKEIIDMHKGKIGAESEFGKGATFSFILPIRERRV